MSKEKMKPYITATLISVIFVTVLSIGSCIIMSGWIQNNSTKYAESSEILDNFGMLAETDIQIILQEDTAKYELAYSYINELILLNNLYINMVNYNATHPFNYTQLDFDEIIMEYKIIMTQIISIVQNTELYKYNIDYLSADVDNNYTYNDEIFFFIINKWYQGNFLEEINNDIKEDVIDYFNLVGQTIEIPEIRWEKWTYHLYNNISMLKHVGISKSIIYIEMHQNDIDLNLVNLSLNQIFTYRDQFSNLSQKTYAIVQDFNNVLITLALAGVLLSFAISFENITYRRISLIIGIIVLLIAIIYFASAFTSFLNLIKDGETIIGENYFAVY
ncbi:MAG: hypothetical protein ACFFDW_06165 [Candidatus Thorarchaeota archaeon]